MTVSETWEERDAWGCIGLAFGWEFSEVRDLDQGPRRSLPHVPASSHCIPLMIQCIHSKRDSREIRAEITCFASKLESEE